MVIDAIRCRRPPIVNHVTQCSRSQQVWGWRDLYIRLCHVRVAGGIDAMCPLCSMFPRYKMISCVVRVPPPLFPPSPSLPPSPLSLVSFPSLCGLCFPSPPLPPMWYVLPFLPFPSPPSFPSPCVCPAYPQVWGAMFI